MSVSSFTSLLIWLPIGAAIAVWVLPLSRYATGSLAVLVGLAEVGIWIEQAARFDFSAHGLQFSQKATWIKELHVSYHVGEYGFSLWLVGLTVVAMAACIGYGFWVGRDRPRAYFGLMLFLTGATVGVFVSQDLLLFYAFFEAMLIPLYVLVGVWGGPGRLGATIKFVIYTMTGSLLMLAALIVYGLKAGTFDLVDGPTSVSRWVFLGFMLAFVIKAPLFPFHGWLPDAYRQAPPEVAAVLSGVIAKAGVYGMLRIAITKFPEPTSYYRTTRAHAGGDRARVRIDARVPSARLPRGRCVLVARAIRADRARPLLGHEPRLRRRRAADGRARAHLDRALPDRRHDRAPRDDRPVQAPRRDGEGDDRRSRRS